MFNVHTCSWRESGYSSHSHRDALNFCDFRNSSFGRTACRWLDVVLMSVTFSKIISQCLASTLAGVGDRDCESSLANILIKENGSVTDKFNKVQYILLTVNYRMVNWSYLSWKSGVPLSPGRQGTGQKIWQQVSQLQKFHPHHHLTQPQFLSPDAAGIFLDALAISISSIYYGQ